MQVHIVANLTARGLLRSPARLDALRANAAGKAQLHETASVAELGPVMRAVLEDGVDLLILVGGDGTFMSGVSALSRALAERAPLVGAHVGDGRHAPRVPEHRDPLPTGQAHHLRAVLRDLVHRADVDPLRG